LQRARPGPPCGEQRGGGLELAGVRMPQPT
jgi:hypothetical protein